MALDQSRRTLAGSFENAQPMSRKRIDQAWTAWLAENRQRRCNPEELLAILLNNAFDIRSIRDAMGPHYPVHSPLALAAENRAPDPVDYAAIAATALSCPASGATRFDTDKLQLYSLAGFMSDAECDEIVAIIDHHLRPSTVTIASPDKAFRTSRTSDLSLLDSPVVARLDEKIARAVGIRPAYSEGIQAQRYEAGGEFKAHTDYFEPGTAEYAEHAGARGNRTWTFMMYLNRVEAGGATRFFAPDHAFAPVKGTAIAWNNLHVDGTVNPHTLHAGMPVLAAHKIIITKWFRERGLGPMRYEDI
jgi:prolyl 4-hydroxylase